MFISLYFSSFLCYCYLGGNYITEYKTEDKKNCIMYLKVKTTTQIGRLSKTTKIDHFRLTHYVLDICRLLFGNKWWGQRNSSIIMNLTISPNYICKSCISLIAPTKAINVNLLIWPIIGNLPGNVSFSNFY